MLITYSNIHTTYDFIFRSAYIDFNIGSVSYVFLGRMLYCAVFYEYLYMYRWHVTL